MRQNVLRLLFDRRVVIRRKRLSPSLVVRALCVALWCDRAFGINRSQCLVLAVHGMIDRDQLFDEWCLIPERANKLLPVLEIIGILELQTQS